MYKKTLNTEGPRLDDIKWKDNRIKCDFGTVSRLPFREEKIPNFVLCSEDIHSLWPGKGERFGICVCVVELVKADDDDGCIKD